MFLAATISTRIWRLGNQLYSVQCRLSDFSVKISGSVVLDKLRQGRLVKLSQHVLKLGRIRLARGERRAVHFPQRAYESIAVLSAQLAVPVAMAVIDAHEVPLIFRVSR
jgi:hypothetical protein